MADSHDGEVASSAAVVVVAKYDTPELAAIEQNWPHAEVLDTLVAAAGNHSCGPLRRCRTQ